MATDPAVTGPGVWLQLVKREVENAGIDNAGASSNGFADRIFTDHADHSDTNSEEDLVLPSLELDVESAGIDNAGAFSNGFADRIFTDRADHSDTSSEEDLVLPSLELDVENAGIDNAGAASNGFADLIFTDSADHSDTNSEEDLVHPSLELEMENVGTHRAGSNDEEELVLPPISVPRSVEDNGFGALHLGPLELIREESEDDSNVTHICRNSCGPDDENTDTVSSLKALVELGCQCRGSMSRMCIMCLLKWFGPRIMLEKDMTCEVCQTRMNESVKKTVLRALADHTGGREILIEALGPPLVRAHNARGGIGRMDPVVQDDDVNANELPDAPNGAAHASLVPVAALPDAPPATPASPSTPAPGSPDSPGSGLPVPAPIQRQSRSFWSKIRRHMCCAAPTPVLEPL